MGRIDKVAQGALKAGFLEEDEVPQALGLARSGQPVVVGQGPSLKAMLNRFALLATDRKLHAFRLGQAGFKAVKEEVFSAPYEELEAEIIENGNLEIRRKGETSLSFFLPIPFGSKYKELHVFLRSRDVPVLNRDYSNAADGTAAS